MSTHITRPTRLRTVATGFLLTLVALILSCGGDSNTTADGKKIIRFWQFWTEPKVKAVVEKAVADFETANPEYKVEITDLTWGEGHQKIVAAFNSGDVPDLLELGSDWIAEFAAANALTDLSSEYNQIGDQYVGWPSGIYDDRCWAMPWYLSTRVLYVNNKLALRTGMHRNQPPVTWDELEQDSRFANRFKPEFYGYGVPAAEKHVLYKKFLPFLWSNGGDVLQPDSVMGTRCALQSRAANEALQFLVDLSQYGIMEKQKVLDDLFMTGHLLFNLSGDWLYRRIDEANIDLDYYVAPIPIPSPESGTPKSFAGGEFLTIPRPAREPLGAIKLARFLLNGKNVMNLCIATGSATPVRIETGDNIYFNDDPIKQVFMQQLVTSKSPPVNPHWVQIETELEWGIEQALYQKLTVEDALEQTCERINKILAQPPNQ